MDFKKLLDTHLNAINKKDITTFLETVCKDNITLIMPNGKLITNYLEFSELHKAWFADEDWSMDYKTVKIDEREFLSSVLLEINYHDVDENNEPTLLNYFLYLLFEKINTSWYLIHDQNTIIK